MFSLLTCSEVPGALAADADAGDVKLAVGRSLACSAQHVARQGHEGGHGAGSGQEAAPGDVRGRLRIGGLISLHIELRCWTKVIERT